MLVRSLTDLAFEGRWARALVPKNLTHERLELFIGDPSCSGRLHLRKHLSELLVSQVLAFASEALLQVRLRDVASVVNVEVVEGESHIGLRDGSPSVDSDSEELGIVDFTVVVEVDALEDLIDFALGHVQLIEGCSNLLKLQRARVVGVERSEGVSQLSEVKRARVNLVDEEGEGLDLEFLRLAEVLDAAEDHEFVLLQELWVVSRMVLLNIVRREPWVLEALLRADSASRVLLQHLGNQVFCRVGDVGPVSRVEREWLLENVPENFLVVIALERRVAAEEDEEDDAEGPDVAGLVVVALEHLRRDVVRSANHRMHPLHRLLLREAFGQAKVN